MGRGRGTRGGCWRVLGRGIGDGRGVGWVEIVECVMGVMGREVGGEGEGV